MLSLDTSLTNRNAAAVLLAWQRDAASRGQSLAFVGVPAQLAELAALYGVDSLLQLGAQAGARGAQVTVSHRH